MLDETVNKPQPSSFLGGFLLPHPPVIVPAVGKGRELEALQTIAALGKVSEISAAMQPETIVLISPHAPVFHDFVFFYEPIDGSKVLGGSLQQFGDNTHYSWKWDRELQENILRALAQKNIPAGTQTAELLRQYHYTATLDHGTLVPLYYLSKIYKSFRLIVLASADIPSAQLLQLGRIIREESEHIGRRTLLIASGDLSHKVNAESPYGAVPEGAEFDARIKAFLASGDLPGISSIDTKLRERAAECGYRSILTLCGALETLTVQTEMLSYEAPFGIGYAVASLLTTVPEVSPQVHLAKATLDAYISHHHRILAHEVGVPEELLETRAGVFVSLHKFGQLRGCIGTIAPTTSSIADEIIQNAISAATRDPRFMPVEASELPFLDIHVDILNPAETVTSRDDLDPKKYGVIVEKCNRRGLLLPDLEGVDTVEHQLEIACQKAGIDPKDDFHISRFTVTRYER